jgi:hypothetical protein
VALERTLRAHIDWGERHEVERQASRAGGVYDVRSAKRYAKVRRRR